MTEMKTPLDQTLSWIKEEVAPRLAGVRPLDMPCAEEKHRLSWYRDVTEVADVVEKCREIGNAIVAAANRWDASLKTTKAVEREVKDLEKQLDAQVMDLMIALSPPGFGDEETLAELGLREKTLEDRWPPGPAGSRKRE